MFPNDVTGNALLASVNARAPDEGLGTVVHKTKNLLCAVWDFTVLGGLVSTINLVDDQGNPAILPKGALVTNVVARVLVAGTSGGSATVSLGMLTATDLQAATAVASLTLAANIAGVPVGTAATWVGPVTAVGGTNVTVGIAVAAMTAGKIKYFIEYVIQ